MKQIRDVRGSCKTSGFPGSAGILSAFFKDLRARRPRSQGFCKNLVILFLLFSANIALAADVDISGEWIVREDDAGDAGIIVTFREQPPPPPPENKIMISGGRYLDFREYGNRVAVEPKSYFLKIIPVGTFFDFTASGTKLTGSIIRNDKEDWIIDGKVNGNKITFTIRENIGDKTYPYSYTGEVSDDVIRFDVKPPANSGDRFQFAVKRVMP